MNKVILTGNLVQDIEIKYTSANKAFLNNKVAVRKPYKNDNGEYGADFISLSVWGNQAEYLAKHGKKGDRVELVGNWNTRNYQNADGTTVYINECMVETIQVISNNSSEEKQEETKKRDKKADKKADAKAIMDSLVNEDDLPF